MAFRRFLTCAWVSILLAHAACHRKPRPLLDPATLPQVDRVFPTFTSDVPLGDEAGRVISNCYGAALAETGEPLHATLRVHAAGGGPYGDRVTIAPTERTLAPALSACLGDALARIHLFHLDAGAAGDATLTLTGERRREPAPPGPKAVEIWARRLAEATESRGFEVVGTRAASEPRERFGDGKVVRDWDVFIDVRFAESGDHDACGYAGLLGMFRGPCDEHAHHVAGQVVSLRDTGEFVLGPEGWEASLGQYGNLHFYGDVVRER